MNKLIKRMMKTLLISCLLIVLSSTGVMASSRDTSSKDKDEEIVIETVFPELSGQESFKIAQSPEFSYTLVAAINYTYRYDDYVEDTIFTSYTQPDVYLRDGILTKWEPTYVEAHSVYGGREIEVTIRGKIKQGVEYEGNTVFITREYVDTTFTFEP